MAEYRWGTSAVALTHVVAKSYIICSAKCEEIFLGNSGLSGTRVSSLDALLQFCRYYAAPSGLRCLSQEVRRANQERTPRSQLLSRSAVNGEKDSRPRLMSGAVIASWAAPKNCSRNSVAMIHARADLAVDFKRCCMLSGEFDGSDRDY